MRSTILALALAVAAYVAGTLVPRAAADIGLGDVASELRAIRGELTQIRRALERR